MSVRPFARRMTVWISSGRLPERGGLASLGTRAFQSWTKILMTASANARASVRGSHKERTRLNSPNDPFSSITVAAAVGFPHSTSGKSPPPGLAPLSAGEATT